MDPPQIIDGKYEVIRPLGAGGMGAVFEARNVQTSRSVAVKVIASALLAKGSDAAARFRREVRATSALVTPHVVTVLDAGTDGATGDPYIVMELLVGEDLKQLVQRLGPIQPDVALRIVAQACAGLRAAHEAGIIHRDIKSANLFLARGGDGDVTIKIVDFGIAKVVAGSGAGGQSTELTHTGSMLGSPRYMSPEQAKGERDLTCRSDLWSLGVVLYELLTGTTPHAEIDSVYALVVAIGSRPAPPVQQRAPWLSPEHAAIVARALEIDPDRRFASAAEMLRAVTALLPGGTSIEASMLAPVPEETRLSAPPSSALAARASSTTEGSLAISATSRTGTAGATGARPARRRAMLFTAGALSLLLLGGLVARAFSGRAAVVAAGDDAGPVERAASPPPPASAAPERGASVRLAVAPQDVTVEIDGLAAPVREGGVELSGAIGSVHQVRLAKGGQQATTEVVITERGALPPSVKVDVALPASPRGPPSGGAAARPSARPARSTEPPPPSRSKDPRPATEFE
jgi:serine/threonine protein kinase